MHDPRQIVFRRSNAQLTRSCECMCIERDVNDMVQTHMLPLLSVLFLFSPAPAYRCSTLYELMTNKQLLKIGLEGLECVSKVPHYSLNEDNLTILKFPLLSK